MGETGMVVMRRKQMVSWWHFAWLMAGLWAWPAHATIMSARSLDQMILDAGQIVRGKVLSKRTFWGQGHKHIYTEYKLQVLASLKGQASQQLTLHVLGGQIGQRISRIAGVSHFKIGEEVVVFLEPKRHKVYQFVLGMAAGKYTVYQQQGKRYLHRSLHGLSFQQPVGQMAKGQSIQVPRQSETPMQWSALQRRVQALKGQIALRKMRQLRTNGLQLRHKYLRLLGRHQALKRLQQHRLKQQPRFGALLPRPLPRHIGALPTPKRVQPQPIPTQPTTRGGH